MKVLGSIEWRRARGEDGGLVDILMSSCIQGKCMLLFSRNVV